MILPLNDQEGMSKNHNQMTIKNVALDPSMVSRFALQNK
jgi:hypothetical protein